MPLSPRFLKGVRLTHLYLGVFIAPAVLFFAITGALQTFSLHETTRGSSYQPPRAFVILAQIHKKQTTAVPARKPQPASDSAPPGKAAAKDTVPGAQPGTSSRPEAARPAPPHDTSQTPAGPQHNTLPLKIFFLIVAVGLCLSTFSGIYMAFAYSRSVITISTLLLLGTAIPVLMIVL